MIVSLVSAKGGVGKTTLAAALAIEAVREGFRTAILDLDPMGALGRFWELRGEPENPHLLTEPADLVDGGYDAVFIDSPPSMMAAIEDAVELAHFVLVPVKASPIDLESVDVVIELCEKHKKKFAFVMTMFDPNHKHAASSVKYLQALGHEVLKETITDRPSYVAPMQLGKTGPETQDRRAAKLNGEEVKALWKAVKARAQKKVRR